MRQCSYYLIAAALLLCTLPVYARLLDDVDISRANGTTVIGLNFAQAIQYRRHIPLVAGSEVTIYFNPMSRQARTPGAREHRSRHSFTYNGKRIRVSISEDFRSDGNHRVIMIFSQKVQFKVIPGRGGSVIEVVLAEAGRQAAKKTKKEPVKAGSTRPAIRSAGGKYSLKQTQVLMDKGRNAIKRKQYGKAIGIFSRIVESGHKKLVPAAHELLGISYERAGKKSQARVEYRLYLKYYPDGEAAERVKQRLAVLESRRPGKQRRRSAAARDDGKWQLYGTWAQAYYRGNRKTDTTTINGPTIIQEPTLTDTDRSSLISNIDVIGRYRSRDYEQRMVFSGDHDHDYIDDQSDGRVSNAYYQLKNKKYDYYMKLGRQSGRAGALGRFDGLLAGINVSKKIRWNVIAGQPFDEVAPEDSRQFRGSSFDFGTFARRWAGSLYYIEHRIDEFTDRQAVGMDLRYFNQSDFFYGLVDYDIYFEELNIVTLQAGWQTASKTDFNILYDERKNPVLQLSNLLLGEDTNTISSIEAAKMVYTEEEMKTKALDRTTKSAVGYISVTHPITNHLRIGADVTSTRVYALDPGGDLGILVALPDTGNVLTYGLKIIGNKFLFKNDITLIGITHTDAETLSQESLYITERVRWQRWLVDLGLKWYERENDTGVEVSRFTPSLRLEYKWDGMSFELEYGQEQSETISATQVDETVRDYYSIGYRWEF